MTEAEVYELAYRGAERARDTAINRAEKAEAEIARLKAEKATAVNLLVLSEQQRDELKADLRVSRSVATTATQDLNDMRQQRDEALALLEELLSYNIGYGGPGHGIYTVIGRARAALKGQADD